MINTNKEWKEYQSHVRDEYRHKNMKEALWFWAGCCGMALFIYVVMVILMLFF